MYNVHYKFEPEILEACKDFENKFGISDVCWGANLDFYPDVENATETNVPLVAAMGIYLEIPNTEDTVISGSIYLPPQIEKEQIYTAIFNSLVALSDQRATPDQVTDQ